MTTIPVRWHNLYRDMGTNNDHVWVNLGSPIREAIWGTMGPPLIEILNKHLGSLDLGPEVDYQAFGALQWPLIETVAQTTLQPIRQTILAAPGREQSAAIHRPWDEAYAFVQEHAPSIRILFQIAMGNQTHLLSEVVETILEGTTQPEITMNLFAHMEPDLKASLLEEELPIPSYEAFAHDSNEALWHVMNDIDQAFPPHHAANALARMLLSSLGSVAIHQGQQAINEEVQTRAFQLLMQRAAQAIPEDKLVEEVQKSVSLSAYGQHDVGWLAFYRFFHDECHLVEETKKLHGLWKLSQSAGWFMPFTAAAIVSERHAVLHRDDQGRLHCLDGPAVMYPDGWSVYAVHGVVVPAHVIEAPWTQSLQEIIKEPNEEVKRIRIERYGWERYLQDRHATPIDERLNDIEGTREALFQVDGIRILLCHCPSTGRIYAMEILGEVTTCAEAQDWLWGNSGIRIIGRT